MSKAFLIDTHAHLDQDPFRDDLPEVLKRAAQQGVTSILSIGIDAATSQAAVRLAQQHASVFAVVGIQPNYAHEATQEDWEKIIGLVGEARVVAIGETGLDRYWDFCPFSVQQDFFQRHLDLARERSLPFIVHCREAEEDVVAMLRADFEKHGPMPGVMHSFAGSRETCEACLALGLHISFAGMVTYKKSQALRDVAAVVPADRLLVETDSPYLTPEPVRKIRRNEPAHVAHTARLLAEVRGVPFEQLASETTANARRLFHLPE